jgi:hypothetical protein
METYCSKVQTEGRMLTFRVYKAHGQTRRLEVQQTMRPEHLGSQLDERIAVCEEDVAVFLQGVLDALTAMGGELGKPDKQTNHERYKEIRKNHPNAYRPWSVHEDERLRSELAKGTAVNVIAKADGRQIGAIRSRIVKLSIVRQH